MSTRIKWEYFCFLKFHSPILLGHVWLLFSTVIFLIFTKIIRPPKRIADQICMLETIHCTRDAKLMQKAASVNSMEQYREDDSDGTA